MTLLRQQFLKGSFLDKFVTLTLAIYPFLTAFTTLKPWEEYQTMMVEATNLRI